MQSRWREWRRRLAKAEWYRTLPPALMVNAISSALDALSITTSHTHGAQNAVSSVLGDGGVPPDPRIRHERMRLPRTSQMLIAPVSCTLRTQTSLPGSRSRRS